MDIPKNELNKLSRLIKQKDSRAVSRFLERLYDQYGHQVFPYLVASQIDLGNHKEALLLAATCLAIDPHQVALMTFVKSEIRDSEWSFLSDELNRVRKARFKERYGVETYE